MTNQVSEPDMRLAGSGVGEVDGVRHTAEHIVVATGSDPIDRLLPREPAPLGQALGEALRGDGIELMLGRHAAGVRRAGAEYVLEFDGARELRGEKLLVATGRRPRVEGIGLETVGVAAEPGGIRVDEYMRAGERLWAIGDVNGIWPLTHVGEYEGDVVAANIAGDRHPANYEAVPRVTYTDPQAAAVGAIEAPYSATAPVSEVPKTAAYTHAYAQSNGFLTLLSDGQRLTGAYALGPEAGEWMQQATLAIRAHVPLEVLSDTIQPFPSFSGIYETVNLIAAGFVDTPLSASLLGERLEARREELRAKLPIGRVVGPADVPALAVHIMTNTALTGATCDIDGGQQFVS